MIAATITPVPGADKVVHLSMWIMDGGVKIWACEWNLPNAETARMEADRIAERRGEKIEFEEGKNENRM